MQSESDIENRSPVRGRGRKRGNGSEEGPVFVDNSGRRSRLLRRFGILVCVACLGYVVVLGMAFMGWGTSLSTSITPFGGGQAAPGGGGLGPQGGGARTGTPPSGVPTGAPTGAAPSAAVTPGTASSTGAN
ncbi:hypothetical protein [Streptomyces avermitilis]|uniref:hypothetical protein n=1 Tax=Streptomyces avermitilis TaxID=33903 RepID=UPI0036A53DF2